MSEIRQFKLVDGSEIVCEVLEWNDDNSEEIVIRNALIIQYMIKDDNRLCSMRPWMLLQVQHNMVSVLNAGHVTIDAHHASETIDNYTETVKFLQIDQEAWDEYGKDLVEEEAAENMNVVTEEEKDNIISFLKNRKDKLH